MSEHPNNVTIAAGLAGLARGGEMGERTRSFDWSKSPLGPISDWPQGLKTVVDFSRIEAGRVRATFQPTDVASFTADLASNFRSACERAGLELSVDCSPLSEPVYVDRGMWEKIVLNLLSNAFKFTFVGGIAVTVRQIGNSAQFSVRDTGTGIPAQELPRLFERFHRIENARGRTHEGSGIGLALVQELVKLHGGSITAQSALGQGTTFVIQVPMGRLHLPAEQVGAERSLSTSETGALPYVEEAMRWLPGAERQTSSGPPELPAFHETLATRYRHAKEGRGDRPRVLIADDNADMRQYVGRLLSEHYRVLAVPDGETALATALEQPPDLILTDVMMPRLDGFGLLKALRTDPRTSGLPVIMLSARAGEESRVEGLEAGAEVDRSLERSQGGLGIGLSLVKGLVELHGGSVLARSDGHGMGSEFVVRLPVALAKAGGECSESANDCAPRKTRRRILVVDDNRDAAMSLAMMLELMGNETQTAHDGLEGLDVAAVLRPDVVMLDIGMPKLNGYETAQRLRQQSWGKTVVLVALTGWGQEDDKRRSQEAGFNFHMVKPVDPGALEKLLADLRVDAG